MIVLNDLIFFKLIIRAHLAYEYNGSIIMMILLFEWMILDGLIIVIK